MPLSVCCSRILVLCILLLPLASVRAQVCTSSQGVSNLVVQSQYNDIAEPQGSPPLTARGTGATICLQESSDTLLDCDDLVIVTAGHVSNGANLVMVSDDKYLEPVRDQFGRIERLADNVSDIEIIRVKPVKSQIPMAYWRQRKGLKQDIEYLYSPLRFQKSDYQHKRASELRLLDVVFNYGSSQAKPSRFLGMELASFIMPESNATAESAFVLVPESKLNRVTPYDKDNLMDVRGIYQTFFGHQYVAPAIIAPGVSGSPYFAMRKDEYSGTPRPSLYGITTQYEITRGLSYFASVGRVLELIRSFKAGKRGLLFPTVKWRVWKGQTFREFGQNTYELNFYDANGVGPRLAPASSLQRNVGNMYRLDSGMLGNASDGMRGDGSAHAPMCDAESEKKAEAANSKSMGPGMIYKGKQAVALSIRINEEQVPLASGISALNFVMNVFKGQVIATAVEPNSMTLDYFYNRMAAPKRGHWVGKRVSKIEDKQGAMRITREESGELRIDINYVISPQLNSLEKLSFRLLPNARYSQKPSVFSEAIDVPGISMDVHKRQTAYTYHVDLRSLFFLDLDSVVPYVRSDGKAGLTQSYEYFHQGPRLWVRRSDQTVAAEFLIPSDQ